MYFFTFHSFTSSFTLFTFAPFISLFNKKHHPILTVVWELFGSQLDHPKKKIGSKPTGSSLVVQTWWTPDSKMPHFFRFFFLNDFLWSIFFSTTLNQLNEPGKIQKKGKRKKPPSTVFLYIHTSKLARNFRMANFFCWHAKNEGLCFVVTLWSPDLC